MEIKTVDDEILRFIEKKFRMSRSFPTKDSYHTSLNKFLQFLRIQYNLDIEQVLRQLKETHEREPIQLLDDFYSYLSNFRRGTKDRSSYSAMTIRHYVVTAKEFLNHEGCHIYNEDLRQRFKLPRKSITYEKGLTKEIINHLLRLGNPKLATIILMACSSGMRINEMIQLRLSDIDFTTNPVTITLRKDTTKTRQTRITHITFEAKRALQDYLRKYVG
jgi:integrase